MYRNCLKYIIEIVRNFFIFILKKIFFMKLYEGIIEFLE